MGAVNLTFVTLHDPPFAAVARYCLQSLAKVSEQMRFHIVEFDRPLDGSLHPSWNKLLAVLTTFADVPPDSWVVWLDADCIVTRPFALREDIEAKAGFNLLPARDWNGLNLAFFAAKNCAWTKQLFQTLLFCGDVGNDDEVGGPGMGCKWEQNSLKALNHDFPAISDRIGTLSFEFITDHPEADSAHLYPVHHYGARSIETRIKAMSKYDL